MTDVLLIGGSGVLGRATLPHLRDLDVVATTRSSERLGLLGELGARGVVCDAYDAEALSALAVELRPAIVVNFLTDLGEHDLEANSRIRRVVGPYVVAATEAAGARRLVVESISFDPGNEAVVALEQGATDSGLEALILRFGLFWGPGTWYEEQPDGPQVVHVDEAGRRAAELIRNGAPGSYEIFDPAG